MRLACTMLIVLLIQAPSAAWECQEYFEIGEGTLPEYFVSTRAPGDSGEFQVQSGAMAHVVAGPAHYVYTNCRWIPFGFSFRVCGAPWDFAWLVDCTASSGRCMRLSHDNRYGAWAYSLSEFDWATPSSSECPDCLRTWHLGSDVWVVMSATGGPDQGWHDVFILHDFWATSIQVWVDGDRIFAESGPVNNEETCQGFGTSGAAAGAPLFDELDFTIPSPVEASRWGTIKGLYR